MRDQIEMIRDLFTQLDELAFEEPDMGSHDRWVPVSEKGKKVFAELTCPENRVALRCWYEQFRSIPLNEAALRVKASIEFAVGESF